LVGVPVPIIRVVNGPFADLIDLRLLAAVAAHGSVSAAAASVRISQPAASRRLHTIQARVGVRLFQFGPRGATLTEAGRFWQAEALKVLSTLDDAQSRFATTFHLRNGLYFAASQVVAEYLVPRWLGAWQRVHTATANMVVGNSHEVLDLVASAKVDFGVLEMRDPPTEEFTSVRLLGDRLVLIVHPSHRWAQLHRPLTVREIAATPLVQRESSSGSQLKWIESLAATGVELAPPLLEVDSLAAVKSAVAGGIAPAILPLIAVEDDLGAGRLVQIAIEGIDLTVWVHAVWLPGTDLTSITRSFIDHLRSDQHLLADRTLSLPV